MIGFFKHKFHNLISDERFSETGSAWALSGRSVATLLGIVISIVVARYYGAEILGIVAVIIAAIIESFAEVQMCFKGESRLLIYGDGAERNRLSELARQLNIKDRVVFKGHVVNPYPAFDSIDCLLMFSLTEGTPRSILESGVRCVPTIANNLGGICEIIIQGQTGYVVEDRSELIYRMKHVIEDRKDVLRWGGKMLLIL